MDELKFVKTTENAFTPTKGSEFSAGFDLYSAYNYVIGPGSRALLRTDLQIQVPQDCYARIAGRSSLAAHFSVDVGAGVCDADFRSLLIYVTALEIQSVNSFSEAV